MSFWEKHRSAIMVGGAVLFLFLLVHFAWARSAAEESREHAEKIGSLRGQLGKMYPEVNIKEKPNGVFLPLLAEVRRDCQQRKGDYEGQLKDLTNRLRFPFKKDFPWVEVPKDAKGQPLQIPGVYLAQRYQIVAENVDKYRVNNPKGSHTKLAERWLGFKPDARPDRVKLARAEDELRKLALADRITKLAIDQGVSWVLEVKPEKVSYEAAYGKVRNPKRGRGQPKVIWGPYKNKFIKNYPVSIKVIGSVDSVMKFFHGMRGQRHFLVIRAFKMDSAAGSVSSDHSDMMRPGEVLLTISAACMDFTKGKASSRKPKGPAYVPSRRPLSGWGLPE